jgi:hypothetical protein
VSALVFPDREFNGDPWGSEPINERLRPFVGLRVVPDRVLPFESTDPKRPGWVHAVRVRGRDPFTGTATGDVLLVSFAAYETIRNHVREVP